MRVPFIQQLPRKFPLKTVAIVSAVGAAAAVACAAFSWMKARASWVASCAPVQTQVPHQAPVTRTTMPPLRTQAPRYSRAT